MGGGMYYPQQPQQVVMYTNPGIVVYINAIAGSAAPVAPHVPPSTPLRVNVPYFPAACCGSSRLLACSRPYCAGRRCASRRSCASGWTGSTRRSSNTWPPSFRTCPLHGRACRTGRSASPPTTTAEAARLASEPILYAAMWFGVAGEIGVNEMVWGSLAE